MNLILKCTIFLSVIGYKCTGPEDAQYDILGSFLVNVGSNLDNFIQSLNKEPPTDWSWSDQKKLDQKYRLSSNKYFSKQLDESLRIFKLVDKQLDKCREKLPLCIFNIVNHAILGDLISQGHMKHSIPPSYCSNFLHWYRLEIKEIFNQMANLNYAKLCEVTFQPKHSPIIENYRAICAQFSAEETKLPSFLLSADRLITFRQVINELIDTNKLTENRDKIGCLLRARKVYPLDIAFSDKMSMFYENLDFTTCENILWRLFAILHTYHLGGRPDDVIRLALLYEIASLNDSKLEKFLLEIPAIHLGLLLDAASMYQDQLAVESDETIADDHVDELAEDNILNWINYDMYRQPNLFTILFTIQSMIAAGANTQVFLNDILIEMTRCMRKVAHLEGVSYPRYGDHMSNQIAQKLLTYFTQVPHSTLHIIMTKCPDLVRLCRDIYPSLPNRFVYPVYLIGTELTLGERLNDLILLARHLLRREDIAQIRKWCRSFILDGVHYSITLSNDVNKFYEYMPLNKRHLKLIRVILSSFFTNKEKHNSLFNISMDSARIMGSADMTVVIDCMKLGLLVELASCDESMKLMLIKTVPVYKLETMLNASQAYLKNMAVAPEGTTAAIIYPECSIEEPTDLVDTFGEEGDAEQLLRSVITAIL